jgi:hypothetical protein
MHPRLQLGASGRPLNSTVRRQVYSAVPRVRLSSEAVQAIAAVWLVWFLFCLGNEYLEWGFFGPHAKLVVALSLLVFAIVYHRYEGKLRRDAKAYERLKRMRESGRFQANASSQRLPSNNRWRGP